MKTNRSRSTTLGAAFALIAFSPAMFADTPPLVAPSNAIIAISVDGVLLQPVRVARFSPISSNTAPPVQWFDIKDCTYDTRAVFFDGFKRLEARVDDQITELAAKRATMNGAANTKDWDFAMKEMVDARSYLKSMGDELSKASPDTWNQQKDKVGLAWIRTQDAYGKVKTSTTV